MNLATLALRHPQLASLVAQYPGVMSLGYLLEKRPVDIDLTDLKNIGSAFGIPGEPNDSHVTKLKAIVSATSVDQLLDMVQSPTAYLRILQFFQPASVESVDIGINSY